MSDEDPDVFQAYLNCVYFGSERLHEHIAEFERQISAFNVKLFVCINSPNRDGHSLAKSFEECGFKIKSVRFRYRTSDSWCYDVEFDDAESATKALAKCNKTSLGGHFAAICVSGACCELAFPARGGLADSGFEALIKLYLLADKLQDLTTANMVMDELISFAAKTGEIPKHAPTSLVYNSTASSSPLRALLSDYWVYQIPTDGVGHLKANDFPKDFLQDVSTKLMLLKLGKATTEDCKRDECTDKCLYDQHDDEHPRCGAQ